MIAAAAVSGASYGYDKLYSYTVPQDMEQYVQKGVRITVPFGRGNQKKIALVMDVSYFEDTEAICNFKPIISVEDKEPVLEGEMFELLCWLRSTTLCTYFEAFHTIIPSGMSLRISQKYSVVSPSKAPKSVQLNDRENEIYTILCSSKLKRDVDGMLESFLGTSDKQYIKSLIDKGFITEINQVKQKVKNETVRMVRLSDEFLADEQSYNINRKQDIAVKFLKENNSASVKELCYICGFTSAAVSAMIKKGVLTDYEYENINVPKAEVNANVSDIVLSEEQQTAYDGISDLIDSGKPSASLLYGITGSGKTLVFVKLIQHTIENGKNAILLIPEISLTPQIQQRFISLFGKIVSVVHSGLSLSQRLNEYKRIKSGDVKIVIGTRSAVFAPLSDIGLIIMDEEGERTYKSESSPKYHAREIAKKRCVTHNAALLMASATPSIESMRAAETGKYHLFTLKNRYSQNPLPDVEIIDLNQELRNGNNSVFSEKLAREMQYNLEHDQQSILLLNRRGFDTVLTCCECHETESCPECSIPLTYHKANNRVMCHYCGYSRDFTGVCSKCGSKILKHSGYGTQKVEDELSLLFPQARILRMDADTTSSRYAYDKNFKAFENGEYDIMIGTQMISKGLDFPKVTLVGVLSVDKALYAGDFRSYERTFSLITQVVGRCGRGEMRGRAYLQTYSPEHYVLNLAALQDYDSFYSEETALRKALIYPPFCDICTVTFSSIIDSRADEASKYFLKLMKEKFDALEAKMPIRVIGPSRCVLEKIKGKYRYRIIIKCKNNAAFRSYIESVWLETFTLKEFARVITSLDINGEIGL